MANTSSPQAQSIQQQSLLPQTQVPIPGGFNNVSLYVGDLDLSVNEGQIYDVFNQIAPVLSVRVCRDQIRRVSLGYGYVNFANQQEANNALEALNFTPINGKPIRIMFSQRNPSIRKSGYANVFIKNLDTALDNKALLDTFAAFGTVLSCKVATDNNGHSKGYGFVQFEQEEAAQNAIKRLNGMLVNDKKVYVGLFVRRQERDKVNGSPKFTNVFVKNLSESTSDEDLKKVFGNYGPITSAVVMRHENGNSRCFGFVNFQNPEDAASAVESLNGITSDDNVWYVGKAQRKAEREAELKAKFDQERNSRLEKLQGANLYLKNLDEEINDEKLKELFSRYGTITSCKVLLDPQGLSRGSGFVAFSAPEEASRALGEMNGKMIGRKPLFVAVAQRKEERKAYLQAQFALIRAAGGMPQLPSGMPGWSPAGPRISPQQMFFGQGTPGLIRPQPSGYGFPQQILPGMRPPVSPNFVMPFHLQRQGHHGQQMGVRRAAPQQMQHQQLLQRNANQGFRYMPNGRNGMDPSMVPLGLLNPMMPLPLDASGVPVSPVDAPRPAPVPITTLTSALASASPEQRHMMLGEQLFPLVERIEPKNAGKVTGMLLEMDQTEVLHLIESPDALKKKVSEAMEVLRIAITSSDPSDQLASFSLNH